MESAINVYTTYNKHYSTIITVLFFLLLNVDGAMHFIYSYKYNINSAEDLFDMNWIVFRA